jgi:hypothetical protein
MGLTKGSRTVVVTGGSWAVGELDPDIGSNRCSIANRRGLGPSAAMQVR